MAFLEMPVYPIEDFTFLILYSKEINFDDSRHLWYYTVLTLLGLIDPGDRDNMLLKRVDNGLSVTLHNIPEDMNLQNTTVRNSNPETNFACLMYRLEILNEKYLFTQMCCPVRASLCTHPDSAPMVNIWFGCSVQAVVLIMQDKSLCVTNGTCNRYLIVTLWLKCFFCGCFIYYEG